MNALVRGDHGIPIHESPGLRIIIPAVQVVEPGLVVVAVSAVQVRVPCHQVRALGRSRDVRYRRLPPRVIHVTHKERAGTSTVDPRDVPLQVLPVEVQADGCVFLNSVMEKLVVVTML